MFLAVFCAACLIYCLLSVPAHCDSASRGFGGVLQSGTSLVDFGVTFTPTKQGIFAEESQPDVSIQVYPSTSCTGGPVRGFIDDVRPGTYILVWKSQPGPRARPYKLRRRCWLWSVDQPSFGTLPCVGRSDMWWENARTQAVEPGYSEAAAAAAAAAAAVGNSTSSIKGVVGSGVFEPNDFSPEKDSSSFSMVVTAERSAEAGCNSDADNSGNKLASTFANAATEVRFAESRRKVEHQAMKEIHHCNDEDGQRSVHPASWCWSATVCAGVGVGTLLCTRVLTSIIQQGQH